MITIRRNSHVVMTNRPSVLKVSSSETKTKQRNVIVHNLVSYLHNDSTGLLLVVENDLSKFTYAVSGRASRS